MKNIVIVTTTRYNSLDEIRCKLACRTIQAAVDSGYPIVLVDDSTDTAISTHFREHGAFVFPQTLMGMGPSRRLTFFYGLQHLRFNLKQSTGVNIWTEPEKPDFVQHCVHSMAEPILNGSADIAIAFRTERCLNTYPRFQRESELNANKAYRQVTGRYGYDPMAGPVAFSVEQTLRLIAFNPLEFGVPDTYIQHYTPILHPVGRVASVVCDFEYPPEQREEEERADNETIHEKRRGQLVSLSRAYQLLARQSIHCQTIA